MAVLTTKKSSPSFFSLFVLTIFSVCSIVFFPLSGHAKQSHGKKVVKLSSRVPYHKEIHTAANMHGIDPTLLAALVKIESSFNPKARGANGARGLTQLKPKTAAGLGVRNIHDPLDNLQGGARYLARCIRTFGDEELGLVAYNRGPFAVKKMQKKYKSTKQNNPFVKRVKAAQRHYIKTATIEYKKPPTTANHQSI